MRWQAGGSQGPEGFLGHAELCGLDAEDDGSQRKALRTRLFGWCLVDGDTYEVHSSVFHKGDKSGNSWNSGSELHHLDDSKQSVRQHEML